MAERNLRVDDIRVDAAVQPRAEVDPFVLDDYEQAMRAGARFPPVTVFHDGSAHWLADGFYRVAAARQAGRKSVRADVRRGGRRDALLLSAGANATHGLRRSNEDKRRAVLKLLDDPDWAQWSDRETARRCGVSQTFVSGLRRAASDSGCQMRRTAARGGRTYTIDTAGIGRAVVPAARERLRGTAIAESRDHVRKLARLPEDQQVAAADLLAAGSVATVEQAVRALARQARAQELAGKAAEVSGDDRWRIITGDCLDAMTGLQAGSYRLVFADPPYNERVDYGSGPASDALPEDEYLAWCAAWMGACARLLTADGSMWVLISETYADRFGVLLRAAGLHRRRWVVWHERFGANCARNFGRCCRHLLYCTRDPDRFLFDPGPVTVPSDRQLRYGDRRADPAGKVMDNLWAIPRLVENAGEHLPGFPTQLPLELVRRAVLCATEPGDAVLDPFSGSGTTGAAAVASGRRYTGIEKNPEFARTAERDFTRLSAAAQDDRVAG